MAHESNIDAKFFLDPRTCSMRHSLRYLAPLLRNGVRVLLSFCRPCAHKNSIYHHSEPIMSWGGKKAASSRVLTSSSIGSVGDEGRCVGTGNSAGEVLGWADEGVEDVDYVYIFSGLCGSCWGFSACWGCTSKRLDKNCLPITLPETNSSHLKMDGWNTIVSFWNGLFSGANC